VAWRYWFKAKGPIDSSLGQRGVSRAKGPALSQPGATPQEFGKQEIPSANGAIHPGDAVGDSMMIVA
jgi:hypothetical protein